MNLESDVGLSLFSAVAIRPYIDLAYARDASTFGTDKDFNDQFYFQGGLSIQLAKRFLQFHFPIVQSRSI